MIWSNLTFQTPFEFPALKPHVIHVWRANLDHYSDSPILSPDEIARAERFKFPLHKHRFMAARSILRRLLSQYLNQTPESLRFEYGAHGKPYLPNVEVYFNLSHANEWALYAISLEEKMGIDIEPIKPDRDIEKIAARFFSSSENELLNKIPREKKQTMFFRTWACKEAFIKAMGEGISSFPLKNFDVAVDENSARIMSIHQDEQEAALWSCIAFDPIENYVAALAIKMSVEEIGLWKFS